jgi:hypothetical protein
LQPKEEEEEGVQSKILIWLCKEWSHFNIWKILTQDCDPRFLLFACSGFFGDMGEIYPDKD